MKSKYSVLILNTDIQVDTHTHNNLKITVKYVCSLFPINVTLRMISKDISNFDVSRTVVLCVQSSTHTP
jgi:hypothetical protein